MNLDCYGTVWTPSDGPEGVRYNQSSLYSLLMIYVSSVIGASAFDRESCNFSRPGTAGEGRPASRFSRSVGRGGDIFNLRTRDYKTQEKHCRDRSL